MKIPGFLLEFITPIVKVKKKSNYNFTFILKPPFFAITRFLKERTRENKRFPSLRSQSTKAGKRIMRMAKAGQSSTTK
jgi:hypothetical protein